MIFDRTIADVNQAIKIRDAKVKKFIELTESEIEVLERGMLTINTLNRIEQKQIELKELLNNMGYYNIGISNIVWMKGDTFDEADFQRVLNNCEILRNAFFAYNTTPNTPLAKYYFSNINDLEKILFDFEKMSEDIKSKYRECGSFECGEENTN